MVEQRQTIKENSESRSRKKVPCEEWGPSKKSNKELKLKPQGFIGTTKEITNLHKTGYFKTTQNSYLKRLSEKVHKIMWNPMQKKAVNFGAIFVPKI